MIKTNLSGELVSLLFAALVVTSVLSGSVSAGQDEGLGNQEGATNLKWLFDVFSAPFTSIFAGASSDILDDSSDPLNVSPGYNDESTVSAGFMSVGGRVR